LKLETRDLELSAKRIKLLLMDCDGVLTDGRLTLLAEGDEQKTFHARDGHGIKLLHRAGLQTGIISGRASGAVERRGRELGISYVRQNEKDKMRAFEELLDEGKFSADQCAFVGDDLPDIPVMLRVGLAVAVADAVEETKQAAHYITEHKGGRGAVREVTELILKSQGRWEELMRRYLVDSKQ
jgi:3-deoxy-D-manno-octulosonate 8-phosphate phosphatase (KDO 8-P phosphatase)